tara:strand:+ start:124 stop:717 length:594 start_codon:yes stop_codon:yes gene_type:complete
MGEPLSFMNWGFNPKGMKSGDYVFVYTIVYVYEDWYDVSVPVPQIFGNLEVALTHWCNEVFIPTIQEEWDNVGEIYTDGDTLNYGNVEFNTGPLGFEPPFHLVDFIPPELAAEVLGGGYGNYTHLENMLSERGPEVLKEYCNKWVAQVVNRYSRERLPEPSKRWGGALLSFSDEGEEEVHEGQLRYYRVDANQGTIR